MEFLKKLNQDLCAWIDENKGNRAVIVLTVERTSPENEEGKAEIDGTDIVIGDSDVLVNLLYHKMTDRTKDENNVLPRLLRKAMSRVAIQGMLHSLLKKAESIEKMAKELGLTDDDDETANNDAETAGKEASHE